jgi:hypothetical protein
MYLFALTVKDETPSIIYSKILTVCKPLPVLFDTHSTLGLDIREIEQEFLLSSETARTALKSAQTPTQWTISSSFLGVKRPRCAADDTPTGSVDGSDEWN